MRILKSMGAALCALTALVLLVNGVPAHAQREPHYLQALSELRSARDYIQFDHGNFDGDRHHAVDEINRAMVEIKRACWDDGKNTMFAPPARGVTTGWAPFHHAQKYLDDAQRHVAQGVDSPQNQGLRDAIQAHIHEAQLTLYRVTQQGAQ